MGHLIVGGMTYLLLLQCMAQVTAFSWYIIPTFFCCMLGALFPDIDTKSRGQKYSYFLVFVWLLYCVWYNALNLFVMTSFVLLLPLLVKHRGLFHNPFFLLSMMVASLLLAYQYCPEADGICYMIIFFFAGALSHVMADYCLSWCKKKWNTF